MTLDDDFFAAVAAPHPVDCPTPGCDVACRDRPELSTHLARYHGFSFSFRQQLLREVDESP